MIMYILLSFMYSYVNKIAAEMDAIEWSEHPGYNDPWHHLNDINHFLQSL